MKCYVRTALSLTIISTFFGCKPADPGLKGNTAPFHSVPWCPPNLYGPETPPPPLPDHPLGTCELLNIALENNPLTSRSWNIAKKSAFDVGVSESELYPTISAQESLTFAVVGFKSGAGGGGAAGGAMGASGATGATGATGAPPVLSNYTQTVKHNLIISYLLLDFGGRQAQIEAARFALLSANWSHNRVLQDVMLNVLESYYNYTGAKGTLEAQQENLEDSKTSLDAAKALFEAGITARLDVLLAESNYINVQLQLEITQGQLNTTLGQLASAIGSPASTILNVADLPKELPLDVISEGMAALIETAKLKRPDLAATFSDFLQRQEAIIIANSAGLPTIMLDANLQQTNYIHQPMFNNHLYTGTIGMNIPIFAGFFYINQTAAARAEAAASYDSWREKKNTVLLDVVTSYYAYGTALGALKFTEAYLKNTQESYDVALASYREGVGSILDLLVAQTALANARAQWVNARTQLLTSAVSVAYATGTL